MPIRFDNSYARLPDRFFARVDPAPVVRPALFQVNRGLAQLLGIDPDELASPDGVACLAGNARFPGSEPIALAYAGHQFGSFVSQLGDGRALLLGEVVGTDGRRRDLQLKGSGPTPFSRRGDGRAALGPVLREYVVSEAMHALGVPTTRALAAVATGETVYRERPLPGAVLTRVAASHIRVGTFEYFAARRDTDALERLTDHALARHYPDAAAQSGEPPALVLLDRVITAQADLVARWMGLGFVHGVMNTDNTSISGETLDYGPCAFLDAYDPDRAFSSIDTAGRYAFTSQSRIALWNLARLAECLLPLVAYDEERAVSEATARLETFRPQFVTAHGAVLRRKLGLINERPGDEALIGQWLATLAAGQVDFTLAFRRLADVAAGQDADPLAALFADGGAFESWQSRWRDRWRDEPTSPDARAAVMRAANPAIIPRNHQVEAMIEAAIAGDFQPFDRALRVLSRPYDDQPDAEDLARPPGAEQWTYRTFCGT